MKKYSLAMILSIPLFLLASAALIFAGRAEKTQKAQPLADELSFVLFSGDGINENIRCWADEDGGLVVFLPSYAKMDALIMVPARFRSVRIDGIKIRNGMDCSCFDLNTEYSITDRKNETTIRFLKSENVATMYVETESGTMEHIHQDKMHKENAGIWLFTDNGELDYRGGGIDKIRGHGNSTWKLDKRPYDLYLSHESDLLDMGGSSRWVLLANAMEPSNLRNKMVLDFADKIGSFEGFAPHSAYVDLYLNGDYAGLYLLTEDIMGFDNTEVLPENGIMFHMDRKSGGTYAFKFNGRNKVRVDLPESTDRSLRQNLKDIVTQFQERLLTGDPDDLRWMDSIDIDSFARKYLVEEIFMNNDAFFQSQYYIWNDLKGSLFAGPCWDYDHTYGEYLERDPRSFLANREWVTDSDYTPWIHELMEKPEFKEKVTAVYRDICLPELEWLLKTGGQQYADTIRQAALLNQIRWNMPEPDVLAKRDMRFLKERVKFLNSAWIEGKSYHTITLKGLYYDRFLCIPDGEDGSCLPPPGNFAVPDHYDARIGDTWYYEGTDEPFDPSTVLTEDITLYVKAYETETFVSHERHIHTERYMAALTLLIMIIFLAVMGSADLRRILRRKCGVHGEHNI
ncbi:MAG: CotH kinase family protein [Lachnospiraceae bacterium]|nr:CotH kinase family protein [Lachnospiraceae bacterium]